MMDRVSFIAEQLRGMSPGVDWMLGGVDRSIELARILDREDITDLWRLQLVPVSYVVHHPAAWVETESSAGWSEPYDETVNGYAFKYGDRQIGYLGTPDRRENLPAFEQGESGYRIAWSAEGHGHVGYILAPNKQTGRLSIIPFWGSSSEASAIRAAIITFVSFFAFTALPLAGVSVGNAIGTAVLPASIASAYPGLATAIGNVALSTALRGGDVKTAVKDAIIGAASGGAGDAAQLVSESALIGSLTAAATQAAIRGTSIAEAVGMAALSHGAKNVGDFFDLTSDPIFSGDFGQTPGFSFDWDGQSIEVRPADVIPDIPMPDPINLDVAQPLPPIEWDPITFDPIADNSLINTLPVDTRSGNPIVPAVTPQPNSSSWSLTNVTQGISAAAMAALQLVKAYRQLDTPTIQPQARVVRSGNAVSVVGNNGLIQTRDASGNIVAGKPPVGVPQATLTGNYIVNNGDGTYSVVAPDGTTRVMQYGGGASGGDGLFGLSPAMTIGLVGLGVAFLARRK